MSLRPLIYCIVVLILFASGGFYAWADRASAGAPAGGQTHAAAEDPIADFLGNPGNAPALPAYTAAGDSLSTVLPAWSEQQDASAESKLGWALVDVTQAAGSVAKNVKNSVTASIGDYVKEKQKQVRQDGLVRKFYVNLDYVLSSLDLTAPERDELTARVKRAYIEDAESGRKQFDSRHFRELPYIVRKEHGEMLLARTRDGEVDTYYLNGRIKTHWVLKNGRPDGAIVTNYENGEILTIDLFKEGRKIRRTKYDRDGRMEFRQDYDYGTVPAAAEKAEIERPAEKIPFEEEMINPSGMGPAAVLEEAPEEFLPKSFSETPAEIPQTPEAR